MSLESITRGSKRASKRRSDDSASTSSTSATEVCALKQEPIDIGPALLLVVHLPGVGILVGSATVPYVFLVAGATENLEFVRALTLANCIFGIFFAALMIGLIRNTWQDNKRAARCQRTTFGIGSFLALGFSCAVLGAFHVWMIPLIYMKTL